MVFYDYQLRDGFKKTVGEVLSLRPKIPSTRCYSLTEIQYDRILPTAH